jgi:hypothetical protein
VTEESVEVIYLIISPSERTEAGLREAAQRLRAHGQVRAISSVYFVSKERLLMKDGPVAEPRGEPPSLDSLVAAVSIQILAESGAALAGKIQELPDDLSVRVLLVLGQTVQVRGRRVPSPDLHLAPEKMIPLCELVPDHPHPILRRTLRELALDLPKEVWGEFYCQGRRIVDTFEGE